MPHTRRVSPQMLAEDAGMLEHGVVSMTLRAGPGSTAIRISIQDTHIKAGRIRLERAHYLFPI